MLRRWPPGLLIDAAVHSSQLEVWAVSCGETVPWEHHLLQEVTHNFHLLCDFNCISGLACRGYPNWSSQCTWLKNERCLDEPVAHPMIRGFIQLLVLEFWIGGWESFLQEHTLPIIITWTQECRIGASVCISLHSLTNPNWVTSAPNRLHWHNTHDCNGNTCWNKPVTLSPAKPLN